MEEYAYREAVGEEIESPARTVDYCLDFLAAEFEGVDDDWLRGPDELIASSPEGEHLIEVQHTYADTLPGLLEGIVEETGCAVVGTVAQYRSVLDCVETGVWIVPTELTDEYSQERMDRETQAWQRGEHLREGTSLPEARRHALETTVFFVVVVASTYYTRTPHYADGLADFGAAGETLLAITPWVMLGGSLLGAFATIHGWWFFATAWRFQRGG